MLQKFGENRVSIKTSLMFAPSTSMIASTFSQSTLIRAVVHERTPMGLVGVFTQIIHLRAGEVGTCGADLVRPNLIRGTPKRQWSLSALLMLQLRWLLEVAGAAAGPLEQEGVREEGILNAFLAEQLR